MPGKNVKENLENQEVSVTNVPRPSIEQSVIESLGINWSQFQTNFNTLCTKWWDASTAIFPDSIGKRLMNNAQRACSKSPLLLSIIADDLACFKKYYQESNTSHEIFELCCLCGAEKILNDFLTQKSADFHLLGSENAIAYTISSGKNDLALVLAQKALKLGKKDPGPLALYTPSFSAFSFTKQISEKFQKSNPAPSISAAGSAAGKPPPSVANP